jgi:predicted MFS family arabinose efflux permease
MWMPLRSTLAMCLSTKDKAGRVLGSLSSVGALASIAGMGVLSVISKLFESVSLRAYYVGCGVFIIAAAVLIVRIPTSVGATETKPPRMLLSYRYWLYYILTFLQGARKYAFDSFCTLVLVNNFGLRVWNISSLLLVSSIINMIAAPYIGRLIDRFSERRMVTLSYVLLSLCCIGFATIRAVWALAFLLIVIKLLIMFGMGLTTYVRRISPEEELTPTLSAGISINHITSVAIPLVAGALLPFIGYEGIFWGTAALILLSVPFALALRVTGAAIAQVESAVAK